jgi:hypothetical protein
LERPYAERPLLQLSDYMLTGALTAPDEKPIEYDSDEDPYQKAIDAYEMYGYTDGAVLADL